MHWRSMIHTIHIQYSPRFKFDYDINTVKKAVSQINLHDPDYRKLPDNVDLNIFKSILDKYKKRFQREIEAIARPINDITLYLPKRRARKLHIGLFGYSRSTGKAVLPRAISFVAALYSMGIPPEILGIASLNEMTEPEYELIHKLYLNLNFDLKMSARYFNYDSLKLLKEIWNIDDEIINMIRSDMRYVENNIGVPTDNSYGIRKHLMYSSLTMLAFKMVNLMKCAITYMRWV